LAFKGAALWLFLLAQAARMASVLHRWVESVLPNKLSDIEDLLAERGIIVSREAIRLWCIKFGALYARRLKRKHRGYGDTFYIDEVFVKINGKQHYLWRAVDQGARARDATVQVGRTGPAISGCTCRCV